MPVYSFIGVIRLRAMNQTPQIVKSIARTVIDAQGVVCSCENWGVQPLAQPTRRKKQWHYDGHWFHLSFACSPETLETIKSSFKYSEDMVRFNVFSRGDTSIKQFGFNDELLPPTPAERPFSDAERDEIIRTMSEKYGIKTSQEAQDAVSQAVVAAKQQSGDSSSMYTQWKE